MPQAETVVYDFDGTLVEGDIGAAFVKHLLRKRLRPWHLPGIMAGLLLMRHPRGKPRGVALFFRLATAGMTLAQVQAEAEAFAGHRALRPRSIELQWLRDDLAAGRRVVVATGALDWLAATVLQRLGLADQVTLVASRLHANHGDVQVQRHAFREGKLIALTDDGLPPPYTKAVSDSLEDLPLFQASRHRVLVNASQATRTALRAALGADFQEPDETRRASA